MLKSLTFIYFFLLTLSYSLFADTGTLYRIAKAEHEVAYVGVRLKTTSTAHGALTVKELVLHQSAAHSYKKVLDVVGERKFDIPEHRHEEQRPKDKKERRNISRRNRSRKENPNGDSRRNRSRRFEGWRAGRSQFSIKEIALIVKNYHLEVQPSDEKIADYETELLIITPKLPNRPIKYISFARENGVILQVKDMDAAGTLRGMFAYTWISFESETVKRKWETYEKEIKPGPPRSQSISLDEAEAKLKRELVQPEYLPVGFQLQDIQRIKGKKATFYLIYTDGLLGFSLFETATSPTRTRWRGEPRRGWRRIQLSGVPLYKHERGPTHAFGWTVENIDFLLLSEMPPDEMLKVITSIIDMRK